MKLMKLMKLMFICFSGLVLSGCDDEKDTSSITAETFRKACLTGRDIPLSNEPISKDTDMESLTTAMNWTRCVSTLEVRLELGEDRGTVCPPENVRSRYKLMTPYELHLQLQEVFNSWSVSNPNYEHPKIATDEYVLSDVALIETWPCKDNPIETR